MPFSRTYMPRSGSTGSAAVRDPKLAEVSPDYACHVEGDDPRGWRKYCLTVLYPGIVVFALCGWSASRTHGGLHDALSVLACLSWFAIAVLGIRGYRRFLRRRYPVFRKR